MADAADLPASTNAQLDALGVHRDGADVYVDTDLSYAPSEPVRVRRDLGVLAAQIAQCSHSVYHALLELTDQ